MGAASGNIFAIAGGLALAEMGAKLL